MRIKNVLTIGLAAMVVAFISCREIDVVLSPKINLEQREYKVKPNRSLLIEPIVENSHPNAVYSWKLNGKVIGTEKNLIFNENELGTYFLTFQVVTENGSDQIEVRVDVVALDLPIIVMEGGNNIILEVGEEYVFKPEVSNKEGLKFSWVVDNKEVSTADEYTFVSNEEGIYFINLKTTNEDGEDEYLIKIMVVKEAPLHISFPYPEQSASLGRTVRVIPTMASTKSVTFQWFVDGVEDKEQMTDKFVYKPSALGKTAIKVVAKKGNKTGEATITLNTVNPEQYYRPITSSSSPYSTKVFEYLPAPGQFINEGYTANTMEEANQYAENRLESGSQHLSLGAFGGYIVVGFDHSITNTGTWDFAIHGNSFSGSSEPGIVWVMQDENGNGLPDDNWYELKGSETGKPGTVQDYEVTYYRPATPKSNTLWTDNLGRKGEVDWLNFHQQDYYYPNWVKEDIYTLRGTCLESNAEEQSGQGGCWINKEFDWGYADNFSPIDRLIDYINYTPSANANHFKISNAITFEGESIHLEYIDFIKVQTGLNVKAGWLGENSTEVFRFMDIQVKLK
ncbi:MAG: PKD-like domain-containing protein [Fermentimonas sp.]